MFLDMIYGLDKTVTIRQYGYRSAKVEHPLISIARDERLEKILIERSGKPIDNHVVYEVTYADGTSFAIMVSDSRMTIGLGVIEVYW